ncbi:hypothetical protein F511_09162 [Dorcoceras hygrometricum]|uniref:Uncharacterized protein n=1 Tax=Dorcoceras hygrometricum TaxID=472368 RepID=A0A2Z7CYV4_9LAMI|nr:hypothetical protein F511_09162 [Dorcoceras hygrometricum]
MWDSTFELFTSAASNSLAVFCFCNFIIGMILVSGSSKSKESSPSPSIVSGENLKRNAVSSSMEERRLSSFAMADDSRPFRITHNDEISEKNAGSLSEKADESIKCSDGDQKSWPVSIAVDEIIVEEAIDSTDKEEDDELRKRIEEFIEKINRGWRDEKLKTFLDLVRLVFINFSSTWIDAKFV